MLWANLNNRLLKISSALGDHIFELPVSTVRTGQNGTQFPSHMSFHSGPKSWLGLVGIKTLFLKLSAFYLVRMLNSLLLRIAALKQILVFTEHAFGVAVRSIDLFSHYCRSHILNREDVR